MDKKANTRPLRVLLVGGGSVGHLAPAVAVWREIEQRHPGSTVRMICSLRTEDHEYLTFENIDHVAAPMPRLSLMLPMQLLQGQKIARQVITDFQPDVVFSKGGALSIPIVRIAKKLGIPVVLHESDAVMGRANRLISRWTDTICVGLPQTMSKFEIRNSKFVLTGNPVRPNIGNGSRDEGLRITGFSGERPILLVWGGSQGAQAINDIITDHLPPLLTLCDVVHITGKGKGTMGRQKGYFPLAFATTELPHLLAMADLAISRSGAGSIAELAAAGVPSILVPLRGLAQDHQEHNARAAEEHGGCMVIEQNDLLHLLLPTLTDVLRNSARLSQMREAMHTLHTPDAAERIAEVVDRVLEEHQAK